jgi:hypothetical protein
MRKRCRRAATRHAYQPVASIIGRAKYGIGAAQALQCRTNIFFLNVWNIAAHQYHAPVWEAPESALHAYAKIACPLANAGKARCREARVMIGRGRENQFRATQPPHTAQQPRQCKA